MAEQPFPGTELPDPGRIASQQDFGRELTLARRRAGLTVRQVARASGVPASTAGDYFAARHLPPASQPELLPQILAACGITGEAEVERWQDALGRVRRAPGRRPAHAQAPYRGLASFQPEDAAWFFGREELALHLVRLATGAAAPGLPLAVVGPSGSGKSSLLRAGLVPRLRAGSPAWPDGRPVVLITPGEAPLADLAEALAPFGEGQAGPEEPALAAQALREAPERFAGLIGRGEGSPAIIVDQFEETFTAAVGEAAAGVYLRAVRAVRHHPGRARPARRLLRPRAALPGAGAVAAGPADRGRPHVREPVAPGHRRARAQGRAGHRGGPGRGAAGGHAAARRGAAAAGHEAGALPLLSHALLATWERSRGGRLTLADYRASGGIRDAIARTAEAAYASLSDGGEGGRPAPVPPAGPRRRRRQGDPRPGPAVRPARRRRDRGRRARALRRGAPGHPRRDDGGDHPRGPARRLATAAGLDRRRPGGHQGPAVHHHGGAGVGGGRAGDRPRCCAAGSSRSPGTGPRARPTVRC